MQRSAGEEAEENHSGVEVGKRSKQAPTVQYKDDYNVEERGVGEEGEKTEVSRKKKR